MEFRFAFLQSLGNVVENVGHICPWWLGQCASAPVSRWNSITQPFLGPPSIHKRRLSNGSPIG
ncbi:hypothetical protein [Micromonospora sp. C81]|uniref:hypothetical protein n=1 Tax=Micromonospora sp. C81 TaxID=2824881 RepID=UPI001B384C70|nr:hypothetical protein [Micromonospora sp. C81]MBQ1039236.1 hypothetical protein [Micromonospora sp. C81]